jgi:Uridine phosphorylase
MEDAFVKSVNWDSNLPRPYFIKAADELIDLFKDVTVKGVTIAASGFYGPQGRVVRLPLAMPNMVEDFEKFRFLDYRITNFEMEGSALAGLSKQLGHKAGTVCCIIANRYYKGANPDYKGLVENLVKLALDRLTA